MDEAFLLRIRRSKMHIRLVITAALIFLLVSDVALSVFAAVQATEKKHGMESSSVLEAINKDKELINMIMQQNQLQGSRPL